MNANFGILSTKNDNEGGRLPPATLGDVLYAGQHEDFLEERDWLVLVNYIAAGDHRALRQLYERTHRLVFSLLVRMTHSRETAEYLTVQVFYDVWKKAPAYDPAAGSVIGWVMNQARAKAIDHLRIDQELNGDILSPTTPLWGAIAKRVSADSSLLPTFTAPQHWTEPDWREVAPGIECKLLATDDQRARVSMVVRLAPETDYPAHIHAGVEELHLLQGELWIDQRQLHPGDYHRAEPGSTDTRVWSQTGCTCVLMTSPEDLLR